MTRVVASPHRDGTAFVAKTGWHRDDYTPFVFRTDDFGETWTAIGKGLPDGTVYAFVQDGKNADLLIHPREHDLVVATHSRGIFVTDISPLQEAAQAIGAKDVHLFAVEPKIQCPRRAIGGTIGGDRQFVAPNEPAGLVVNDFLKEETSEKVSIRITNAAGDAVAVLEGQGAAGLNSVVWDFRRTGAQQPPLAAGAQTPAPAAPGPRVQAALAPPGEYVVVLEIGDKTWRTRATVRPAPVFN